MKIKSQEALLEKEVIIAVFSTLLLTTQTLSQQPREETKNGPRTLLRTQYFLGLFQQERSVISGIHQTTKSETPLGMLEIYSTGIEHNAQEKMQPVNYAGTDDKAIFPLRHTLQYHSDRKALSNDIDRSASTM